MSIIRLCRNIHRKFVRLSRYFVVNSNSKASSSSSSSALWSWYWFMVVIVFILFSSFSILSFIFFRWNDDTSLSSGHTFNNNHDDHLSLQSRLSPVNKTSSKILCYILISPSKLVAAQAIKTTWGQKCDKLLFFGRFNNTELPVQFLNTKEGYRFLWGKTKAALIYLQTNYNNTYDWYLKADDDTFIVTENLRHFVHSLDPNKPIWFGYKLKHPKAPQISYMSGGSGYVYSRSALEKVTTLFRQNISNSPQNSTDNNGGKYRQSCNVASIFGIEDLELGNCFSEAGVTDVSTLDERGRERFLPLPIETLWMGKVSKLHWIWRQAWNPLQLGVKCCSSQIISTHQISPSKMKTLFHVLYMKGKSYNNTDHATTIASTVNLKNTKN